MAAMHGSYLCSSRSTVEDPSTGAHETFLEEMVKVAERVSSFRVGAAQSPREVFDALQP